MFEIQKLLWNAAPVRKWMDKLPVSGLAAVVASLAKVLYVSGLRMITLPPNSSIC
jgi:hypothetical protein